MFFVKSVVTPAVKTVAQMVEFVQTHDFEAGAIDSVAVEVAPGVALAYNGMDYALYLLDGVEGQAPAVLRLWSTPGSLGRSSAAPDMLGAYAEALVKTARKLARSTEVIKESPVAAIDEEGLLGEEPAAISPVDVVPAPVEEITPKKEEEPVMSNFGFVFIPSRSRRVIACDGFRSIVAARSALVEVAEYFQEGRAVIDAAMKTKTYRGARMGAIQVMPLAFGHEALGEVGQGWKMLSLAQDAARELDTEVLSDIPLPVDAPAPVVEVAEKVEEPAPAQVEEAPASTGVRIIETGEGLGAAARAELIAPALAEAAASGVLPVFVKFSHYTEANRLHIAVGADYLLPVVIDEGGLASQIEGVTAVQVEGNDFEKAALVLLKRVRAISKAVNRGEAVLSPAGVVAAAAELVAA